MLEKFNLHEFTYVDCEIVSLEPDLVSAEIRSGTLCRFGISVHSYEESKKQ